LRIARRRVEVGEDEKVEVGVEVGRKEMKVL